MIHFTGLFPSVFYIYNFFGNVKLKSIIGKKNTDNHIVLYFDDFCNFELHKHSAVGSSVLLLYLT